MTFKLFLPGIYAEDGPNPDLIAAQQLAVTIAEASWQQRVGTQIYPLLMQAAQWKAEHMAVNAYFGHIDPWGGSPNDYVRAHGYPLPSYYPVHGNNVESLYSGWETVERAILAWTNSERHRIHLRGENDFYRAQIFIGTGRALHWEGRSWLWVFISAPPM
jgi:hypothetical protein